MDDANDSLGALFRAAREPSGRQIADIAAELHINAAHLQALENDALEKLPSPSFAKGYIRAYARALEVDPEPLLKAYLRAAPPPPVWQANKTVIDEREKNRTPVVLVTAVVAAILVALFVIWFLNSGYLDKETSAAGDEATVAASIETEVTPPESVVVEEVVEVKAPETESIEPSAAAAAAQEPSAKAAPADSEQPEASPPEAAKKTHDSAPASVGEQATQKETHKKKMATRLAPTKDNPDLIRAPKGSDKLEVSLTDDSWVEITDANGQRLLRGLYLKDAHKTLVGKAPFQVFLGNAPAVALQSGGKSFDVKRYVRANKTARFAVLNP